MEVAKNINAQLNDIMSDDGSNLNSDHHRGWTPPNIAAAQAAKRAKS
ncbi:MAG: hypothetical protein HRU28_15630 [Rhizobiales bacterium]|nr:hypothetical protein [Hyphomicrobiales bacterium]